jgi:CBS-domain-containing membrane protein
LQYALTTAPASQPRNVVLGQVVAGAVSMSFTYIPESMLPVWIRRAVAPAFAIAAMVKLGIPHPPAGAHAVIYASGDFGFTFYFLSVLASALSIVPATLVNNMSTKRQYPTYWGYCDLWLRRKWMAKPVDAKKSYEQ